MSQSMMVSIHHSTINALVKKKKKWKNHGKKKNIQMLELLKTKQTNKKTNKQTNLGLNLGFASF